MKARNYLGNYRALYRQAERLTDELKVINARIDAGAGAIRYDKEPVATSTNYDSMRLVDRKIDLELVLADTIKELAALRSDMARIFERMPNRYRRIAELTWFDFEGAVYIAQQVGCSLKTVYNRRHDVIRIVQEFIDQNA